MFILLTREALACTGLHLTHVSYVALVFHEGQYINLFMGVRYLTEPCFRENLPGHFKFKEYCPRVFHNIRKRLGIDDLEYMVSIMHVSS